MNDNNEIDIENGAARAKKSMHESGHPMVVLQAFKPLEVSREGLESTLRAAQRAVDPTISIIRVYLEADQGREQTLLEDLGFAVDGFEFSLDLTKLADALARKGAELPPGLTVRKMDFDRDIDAVVALEKSVHAADETSRVNFDSEEAIVGMRAYYKKAADGNGVYLLVEDGSVVGLIGFMPDRNRANAVHISSAAITLAKQGQGLFLPMLLISLKISDFKHYQRCTGVTTTLRLIEAAKRYSAELLGISLSRMESTITTKVLEPKLWSDLEQFFLAEKCSGCWCMNHRVKPGESLEGESARLALAAAVAAFRVSGILAFDGDKPVGWCAFDRIADLPGLDCGYPVTEAQQNAIWSIHCVSVLSGYPKDFVVEQMIAAAVQVMRREGAKVVEAYPPPSLPSDNTFSGTMAVFERQGFLLQEHVSKHYARVVKQLADSQ